jgi:hypothetical protein
MKIRLPIELISPYFLMEELNKDMKPSEGNWRVFIKKPVPEKSERAENTSIDLLLITLTVIQKLK